MKAILNTNVVAVTDVAEPEGDRASSAATIAQLHSGVLVTADPGVRAERPRRLSLLQRNFDALPINDDGPPATASSLPLSSQQDANHEPG